MLEEFLISKYHKMFEREGMLHGNMQSFMKRHICHCLHDSGLPLLHWWENSSLWRNVDFASGFEVGKPEQRVKVYWREWHTDRYVSDKPLPDTQDSGKGTRNLSSRDPPWPSSNSKTTSHRGQRLCIVVAMFIRPWAGHFVCYIFNYHIELMR